MADCINCGASDTEEYDLEVRNSDRDKAPLCTTCHDALAAAIDE
jgi:hypothetical protein